MDQFQEARNGAESAFLQLFDDHHVPLFRFAYRLTGSVSDAEDVVQECFLELLRPGCSYNPRRTPISYQTAAIERQSGNRRRTLWMAPDLGCFALRVTTEVRRSDGSFHLVNEKEALKVTLNH
jgi:DNA-directed RNA polymerase specialized sigma24 family protein